LQITDVRLKSGIRQYPAHGGIGLKVVENNLIHPCFMCITELNVMIGLIFGNHTGFIIFFNHNPGKSDFHIGIGV
jgi:hypothetical protein